MKRKEKSHKRWVLFQHVVRASSCAGARAVLTIKTILSLSLFFSQHTAEEEEKQDGGS